MLIKAHDILKLLHTSNPSGESLTENIYTDPLLKVSDIVCVEAETREENTHTRLSPVEWDSVLS